VDEVREGYNTVKNAARAASEVAVAVERLRGVVEELNKALRDLVDKLTQLTAASAAEAARESSALNTT
jgi:phage shock protein A